MPAEKFWPTTTAVPEDSEPTLNIAWGDKQPGVTINGVHFDRSGLNRLIRVIRNARDRTYERDE